MLSNLLGGNRVRKRQAQIQRPKVTRKKHIRRKGNRRSKNFRKRRLYRNYFPYETYFYDKQARKVKIYIGDGRFVEHKKMLNHLVAKVKFIIRQDANNMKFYPRYRLNLNKINKWEKWAKFNAERYVRKYSGRVIGGRFWELGMSPGEIVRRLYEDWEFR